MNKKKLYIIIASVLVVAVVATSVGIAVSKNKKAEPETTTIETTTEETTTEIITEPTTEEITEETTEETTAEKSNSSNKSSNSSSSSKSNGSNKKPSSNSSSNKKPSGGNPNSNSGSSSNKKPQPTKPQTTKPVKHVNPKDVQNEVNNYIRSLGVKVDSSYRPDNSGWDGEISGMQKWLDKGTTLRICKEYVDMNIAEVGKDGLWGLYCYYENETFYILYDLK